MSGQRDELRLVADLLASLSLASADSELVAAEPAIITVLDCGGGTGRMAVPLAELGAHVTVVDISVDALATLSRRAAEAGVADRVRAVQGDIEALADAVGAGVFDLVLVHGVLEVVDPRSALAGVWAALRPGGRASVLVANPAAAVLAKVLAGELEAAVLELQGAPDRLDADAVARLCVEVGLIVEQVSGVGVFADLIAFGSANSSDVGGRSVAELTGELEALSRTRSPFREIASRLHVLARRPPTAG
jgi:S-adenosylmethionine-dependent methyltransferase